MDLRAAIIDIDRVLFDPMPRLEACRDSYFVRLSSYRRIDWPLAFSYFIRLSSDEMVRKYDKPIPGAAEWVQKIAGQGLMIVYLTERSETCREATTQMLKEFGMLSGTEEHNAPYGQIVMRSLGDKRSEAIIKKVHIRRLKLAGYNFIFAVDDDYNGSLAGLAG